MKGLLRHVTALRNVSLPGGRLAFRLAGTQVGWVERQASALLAQLGCEVTDDAVTLRQPGALAALAHAASCTGAFPWRGEAFDVRALPGGPVLATVDRGALPWLGIMAEGVHVNGLVHRPDGLHLWVAQRAPGRLMDPGKLDHMFAGGVAAGATPQQTLVREGAEEAGLPETVVRHAAAVGVLSYATARPEGLRRDRLHCYDLVLPDDVTPVPSDGEVAGFALWPLTRVVTALRETDRFKFNVAVVLLDLLLRLDALRGEDEDVVALREALAGLKGSS